MPSTARLSIVSSAKRSLLAGALPFAALLFVMASNAVATASATPTPPYINSPFADAPVEPTRFTPLYVSSHYERNDNGGYIRNIKWSSWGGIEAVGTGEVGRLESEEFFEEGYPVVVPELTSPVTVTLGGRTDCAGIPVYTTYSLELAPGAKAPKHWPHGKSGSFPCKPTVYGYGGFQTKSGEFQTRSHPCLFEEFRFGGSSTKPHGTIMRWQPKLPQTSRKVGSAFCYMKWKHWGGTSTSAEGIRRTLTFPHTRNTYWPATLELSDPIWCPIATSESPWLGAITYSSLRVTLYGDGTPTGGTNNPPQSAVGDHTGKKRVYRERIRSSLAECVY